MKGWTESGECCRICGTDMFMKEGKTIRYDKFGRPYVKYTHYMCPKFSWWQVLPFVTMHTFYTYVRTRQWSVLIVTVSIAVNGVLFTE